MSDSTDLIDILKKLGIRAMVKAVGHLPPDLPTEAKLIALDTLEMGVGFALEGVKTLLEGMEPKRVKVDVAEGATVDIILDDSSESSGVPPQ